MTALPQPGQTWLSRDGRVAQVFQNPDPGTREAYPIAAEYSDGVYCLLLPSGAYSLNGGFRAHHDLTARSPWDAVREAFATRKTRDLKLWRIIVRIQLDAFAPVGGPDIADIDSEALEFIAWAELRGLTPDNIADMRGKVAA